MPLFMVARTQVRGALYHFATFAILSTFNSLAMDKGKMGSPFNKLFLKQFFQRFATGGPRRIGGGFERADLHLGAGKGFRRRVGAEDAG